jgi:hypothetical protein
MLEKLVERVKGHLLTLFTRPGGFETMTFVVCSGLFSVCISNHSRFPFVLILWVYEHLKCN